nr:hypothetical protein [uncultured Fretibacterium sp.]
MEKARESRWGRGGFLVLGMAMGFVLGYVLGGVSAVGAVPGDSLKETPREERPHASPQPTQDKRAVLEALYEDTGMRTCSIEGTHAIRALLSFYDRLNLKAFEDDQKAFESVHGELPDEERRKRRRIFEEERVRMLDLRDKTIAQGFLDGEVLCFFIKMHLDELRVVTPRPLLKLFAEDVMGPVSADFYRAYGVLPETVADFSDLDQGADPSLLTKRIVFGGEYGELANARRPEREKEEKALFLPVDFPPLRGLLSFYASLDIDTLKADQRKFEAEFRPLTGEEREHRLKGFEEERAEMEVLQRDLLERLPVTYDTLSLWVSRTLGTLRAVTPRPLLTLLAEDVLEPLSMDILKGQHVGPDIFEGYSDLDCARRSDASSSVMDARVVQDPGVLGELRAYERTRRLIASGQYREPYEFFRASYPRRGLASLYAPIFERDGPYLPPSAQRRREWLAFYFSELEKEGQKDVLRDVTKEATEYYYLMILRRLRLAVLLAKSLRGQEGNGAFIGWNRGLEVIEILDKLCNKMLWIVRKGYSDSKLDRELSSMNGDAVISLEPLSSIVDIFDRHFPNDFLFPDWPLNGAVRVR